MAKEIIILNNSKGPGGDQNVVAAFWFAVTSGQQIALPSTTSVWRGASASENASIAAGKTVEQIYSAQYPAAYTLSQIETALQTAYTTAQTAFNALPNPNTFYGAFWDGATWTAPGALPPGNVNTAQFGSLVFSTSGDNTIITGVSGQALAILQLQLAAAGAVTVLVKDGSTTIGGYVFPTGGGSPVILPQTTLPWFVTSAGNNFVLNLSATVNVAVSGWYRQA